MKHIFLLAFTLAGSATLHAQVGIGTTTPKAYFNVADGKDVLFGNSPTGTGTKLLWDPVKGAFRVGTGFSSEWDAANVGLYSTNIGFYTHASGDYATAIGWQAEATGPYSMALGGNATASGYQSIAIGSTVSTNGKTGSIILGDYNGYTYSNSVNNQMMMRFSGGYMLYSSSPAVSGSQSIAVGVQVTPGGNAWSVISDSTRKENFRTVVGKTFLQKIATMRLGSWNYKGQDARQYRHYGPMAQDFFAAFGHDELGVIGEDRSINQADFDGVNLIAIQALIDEVEQLKAKVKKSETENQQLRAELGGFRQQDSATQARLAKLEALLSTAIPTLHAQK